ncbi:hypothetical protein F5884DRAFT_764628 [Xylogone sp. PMI_703]|nr:hypothetical protein F5884DRAFT_764628 [Xylogone sp. PMI_703]
MAAPSQRVLRSKPRTTRGKPALSYAEPPSDTETELENDGEEPTGHAAHHTPPSKLRKTSSDRAIATKRSRTQQLPPHRTRFDSRLSSKITRNISKKKRKRTSNSSTSKSTNTTDYLPPPISYVIPAWQTLPYHILVLIFKYASYPLYDENTFYSTPSCRWLLNTARICRAFAEPALTVLYASPPLAPMDKAHRLVALLAEDPTKLAFKYRQKVESLRIEVSQVAAYSMPGSGLLDLAGLVKHLPRLLDLELYHLKDMPPYRLLDYPIKWSYPESLFEALEHTEPDANPQRGDKNSICKLRSWRWSSRLLGKSRSIESLREMHLKPSFSDLRKVTLVNFQIPILRKDDEDPMHEKRLGEALAVLPNLQHLILESSTLVNRRLLPLLPTNLRNLDVINCWEVISDDFISFLRTHGSQLRCLTLNHNQSLSLSFLPLLGTSCPHLEVLRMNLTFFDLHFTYRDSEPQYEQLLYPGEVPSWPSTLQTIELVQLRKWDTEAAETFFGSLVESAPKLPHLRRLVIQAILSIGWRDRASFRDKWVGSLERVFKRVSSDPRRHQYVKLRQTVTRTDTVMRPRPEAEGSVQSLGVSAEGGPNPESSGDKPSTLQKPVVTEEDGQQLSQQELKLKSGGRSPVLRRARLRTRRVEPGIYAESSESGPESSESDIKSAASVGRETREEIRKRRIPRELEVLKQTAGKDGTELSQSPAVTSGVDDNDSDDQPLLLKKGRASDHHLAIQGMCEVVDIRIDNLRPRETQVTEADFLDSEPEGDPDWNGDDDGLDDGYAW